MYKKLREGAQKLADVKQIVSKFVETTNTTVRNIPADPSIIRRAAEFVDRFGATGLRTLDSLHIATALEIPGITFGTSDVAQSEFAKSAGLDVRVF